MSRRHFSLLLILALVFAAVLALLMPGKTGEEPAVQGMFFEPLDQRINEVDRLVVYGGSDGPLVHLDRREQAWQIRELNGYPADWDRLRELLTGLSMARVIETKTANPEYYARLGVEDHTAEGAGSTLLEVGLPGQSIGVIIGNEEFTRNGQYVRMQDSAQSYLLDRQLEVGRKPLDWADSEIIDIGSALVAGLQISHPDGETIHIRRVSADDPDFKLEGLPEGREARSAWTVNSLANLVSMLRMEAVLPEPAVFIDQAVNLSLTGFSGLEISAELFRHNDKGWIKIFALAPDDNEEASSDADRINQKVSGWVYQLPDMKYDSMTQRMEDLLESNEPGTGN